MIWQSRKSPKNKLVPIIHPCTTTLRFVIFSLSFVFPPLFLTCLWRSSISRCEFHSHLSRLWVCFQATAECKGLTKADSVQATWVGSLAMWNRERVVTANYWTTPAPEIKATASHERTGHGFRGCGSVEGDVGGVEGWVGWKGDRSDLKLQRQSAQEGSMSDFLGVSEVWGWLTPEGRQLRCLWRKACTGVWMAPCCSFVGNSENAPSWHRYYILILMHSGMTSQIWPECLVGILLTVKNAWETDCIHSRRICAIHWLSNMYKQCQYCVTVYSTALSLLLIKVNALMFG